MLSLGDDVYQNLHGGLLCFVPSPQTHMWFTLLLIISKLAYFGKLVKSDTWLEKYKEQEIIPLEKVKKIQNLNKGKEK